jgi:hypothetical protein
MDNIAYSTLPIPTGTKSTKKTIDRNINTRKIFVLAILLASFKQMVFYPMNFCG